jgi:hypothetical protein
MEEIPEKLDKYYKEMMRKASGRIYILTEIRNETVKIWSRMISSVKQW